MSREVCGICWCPYDEDTGACACPPPNVQKSTLRQAAQQALEALRNYKRSDDDRVSIAMGILSAALAEPVQEPDLSRCPKCGGPADNGHDRCLPPNPYHCTKCVAEPATLDAAMAVPLSLAKAYENGWNAAKAEPVEPVAWMDSDGFPWSKEGREMRSTPDTYTPLYPAPPQRKPLTEEEILNIGMGARAVEGPHILPVTFARAIERAHGIGEKE